MKNKLFDSQGIDYQISKKKKVIELKETKGRKNNSTDMLWNY